MEYMADVYYPNLEIKKEKDKVLFKIFLNLFVNWRIRFLYH